MRFQIHLYLAVCFTLADRVGGKYVILAEKLNIVMIPHLLSKLNVLMLWHFFHHPKLLLHLNCFLTMMIYQMNSFLSLIAPILV